VSAELEARRTAAAAVLADYTRAAEGADVADRAMWGARLADTLGYLLAGLPVSEDQAGETRGSRTASGVDPGGDDRG
jgi:hypothetical protein